MQKPTKRKNNFASNLGNAGFGGHLLLRKRTFHECSKLRTPQTGAGSCRMLVLGQKRKSRNGSPVSASTAQADLLMLVLLLVPKGL
jgi:hypothetical protein